MSTRAIINIEGCKLASIYKHCDGYPEAMMDWLEHFNKKFNKAVGDDPEYKFAQLLRHTGVWDYEEVPQTLKTMLGWGVVKYNSDMMQEYTYILKKDGTVKVKNGRVK